MLLITLTLLLITNALSLNKDKSILFSRLVMISLIINSYLSYNNIFALTLYKGIGLYSGLFHVTPFTQWTNIFMLAISQVILTLTSLYARKVSIKEYSSLSKIFFSKFIYNKTKLSNKLAEQFKIVEYFLIIVFVLVLACVIFISHLALTILISLDFTTQMCISLLIISTFSLIYLLLFASDFSNRYPNLAYFFLVFFTVLALLCICALFFKIFFNFDVLIWLSNRFKGYWVSVNGEKRKRNDNGNSGNNSDDSFGEGPSDPKKPGGSGEPIPSKTPEEQKEEKRKKRRENDNIARREKMKNPEYRAKRYANQAESMAKRMEDPEYKAKKKTQLAEGKEKRMDNPEYKEKHLEKQRDYHWSKRDLLNHQENLVRERLGAMNVSYLPTIREHRVLFDGWLLLSREQLQVVYNSPNVERWTREAFHLYRWNLNFFQEVLGDEKKDKSKKK